MNKRPRIFSMIAYVFCLIPAITIGLTALVVDLEFLNTLELAKSTLEGTYFFSFWLVPILGGLSILTMKKFSFPLFIASQIYLLVSPLLFPEFIPELVRSEATITVYTIQMMSLFTIFYFCLTPNRSYFFDPALRLWERATRYHVPIPMSLKSENFPLIIDATILNLSSTGIFFILNQPHLHEIKEDHKFKASISFQDYEITVPIKVVRKGELSGIEGHGAKFQLLGLWSKIYMRGLIKEIKDFSSDHDKYITNQKAS